MKNPVYYFEKLIKHLREGTLVKRISLAMTQQRWALRDRWWDRQGRSREFIDTEVEPGMRLRLYFDSAIARDIYCHDHEIGERAFVHRFLRPGDVFVDVGANLGLYSVIASKAVGANGSVFAFEPDPKTHGRLLFNLKANNCQNVQAFELALSSEDETRLMQVSATGYDAYNSFGTPVRGEGTFRSHEVSCVSFDSFASQMPRLHDVTMMKVDVEGFETMALRGAQKQLSGATAPVLQIEFNDQAAKSLGLPCSELYLWLQKLGYSIYTFERRTGKLIPHPYRDHYVYDNVFAIKDLEFVKSRIQGTRA